ncbi:MAG TPA: indolepyruvate ferredoxin oxidoreductase family protein, partial [Xanthobacteraceae bacterium]|nr:indolepyruvate ferredoxin oxidoreductase family protein [Xanthobacteraceae bacterium]
VWGSQQANLFPGAKFDGVFGIFYGKGPGVDRSSDALKHANAAGSSKHGGVLALAGDDHGCQSSTLAHQSEQIFEAAMMPILNPASIQEYLDFGLYGFALSRFSGCWVGFKAISETVESSASVETDPNRLAIVTPTDFEMPAGGLNIRWPDPPLEAERRLHGPKMAAAAAFARANALDRIVLDSPQPRFGIMTAGKSYLDVRQALAEIGIDGEVAAAMGLRIYKVGLTWPLEPQGARGFADGLKDVLVVEEKRGFLEDQLVRILYNMEASRRPCVVGKRDETGAALLPSEGELSPTLVARAIVSRLLRLGAGGPRLVERLERLESFERAIEAPKVQRIPFFCSGCPHNTSTRVPEGSRAMAGIGCHGMVLYIPSRRTTTISHMGGEGVNWIGQAPFTSEPHVFQNLGDGTYTHSGLLAIRAAAAAGVNITYKILVNDAVAMTGGQSVEGGFTVPQIAAQVAAEGARRVVVVTDEPEKYSPNRLASGTTLRHRDDLDAVQRELRAERGLTVLIYDQTCAAEKRRRRKRGQLPDLPRRVFINDAVCEGCGDCTEQSNCVSVKPLETELGRKRTIDQSNCNQDFSCLKGFCPSFVSVVGGSVRKRERPPTSVADAPFAGLPLPPAAALDRPFSILVTGIGGTGVITVGALIGMAAHLEGKGCTVLDFTGLSQKNGAVMSHIRVAPSPDDLASVRIAPGGADLLLGCDMVVAASSAALSRVERGATRAVINTALAPTAAFVMNTDVDFETPAMLRMLRAAVGEEIDLVDGTALATALMGDAIATNLFMLGYAFQKGFVPLSLAAIERAIELNGVAIEANRQTFGWGRLAAHDLGKAIGAARPLLPDETPSPPSLAEVIARRAAFLSEYQDAAYATRYLRLVTAVKDAEGVRAPGRTELTAAVATNFFKLMAYKDEYEVARLFTDGRFMAKLKRQFAGDFKLQFHLAPPFMARDPGSGHPHKRAFGPWMFPVFRLLARLRRLRGTRFDPFGYTPERRAERALITDYEMLTAEIVERLGPDNHALALALASIPEQIRGFGHVKERNLKAAKARAAELLRQFRSPQPAIAAE